MAISSRFFGIKPIDRHVNDVGVRHGVDDDLGVPLAEDGPGQRAHGQVWAAEQLDLRAQAGLMVGRQDLLEQLDPVPVVLPAPPACPIMTRVLAW